MNKILENEQWVVIDYPEIHTDEKFEISNYGRIKSFRTNRIGGKIIKGSSLTGYNILVIKLKTAKKRTYFIHKVVADYFLGKKPEFATNIIHKDYDRGNNYYKNLQWVNAEQMYAHRRNDPNYDKKKVRNAKLSAEDVRKLKIAIKEARDGGTIVYQHIAKKFNITLTQLRRIDTGKNWGHVKI
jgi:hypothetical protein